MHPSNDERQECKKSTTLRNASIKRWKTRMQKIHDIKKCIHHQTMKDKNARNPRHEMHPSSNDERQECKKSTTFYIKHDNTLNIFTSNKTLNCHLVKKIKTHSFTSNPISKHISTIHLTSKHPLEPFFTW